MLVVVRCTFAEIHIVSAATVTYLTDQQNPGALHTIGRSSLSESSLNQANGRWSGNPAKPSSREIIDDVTDGTVRKLTTLPVSAVTMPDGLGRFVVGSDITLQSISFDAAHL